MFPLGPSGDADDAAAGVHIPMRRTQSGKGRHQVHPAGVLHLLCVVFRILGFGDEAHLIAQPLNDRSAHKDTALQRILHLSIQSDGNGGQQPVPAHARGIAGVHQQKAAGAIGVLCLPFLEAALTKQRRLLVACNSCNRDIFPLDGGIAVYLAAVAHLRQHTARNIQHLQQLFIPVEGVDVVQHGAGSIGVVGHMDLAAGQFPNQPAVHRSE